MYQLVLITIWQGIITEMNKNETVIIYNIILTGIETNGQIYSLFNDEITRQIKDWNVIAATMLWIKMDKQENARS